MTIPQSNTSRVPSIRSSSTGGRNNRLYGDRFRAAREDALRKCGYHCQICGVKHEEADGHRLQAHHWAPTGQTPSSWQIAAHDLTILCHNCHGMATTARWATEEGLTAAEAWRLMRAVIRAAVRARRAQRVTKTPETVK